MLGEKVGWKPEQEPLHDEVPLSGWLACAPGSHAHIFATFLFVSKADGTSDVESHDWLRLGFREGSGGCCGQGRGKNGQWEGLPLRTQFSHDSPTCFVGFQLAH